MTEKIFDSPITDKICNVAQSEEFVNLNPKIQEKVIDSLKEMILQGRKVDLWENF